MIVYEYQRATKEGSSCGPSKEQAGSTSRRIDARLALALKIAETSTEKHKHGAAIFKGGRLISLGVNSRRNDPAYVFDYDRASEHAECCALRIAMNRIPKVDLTGAEIYVARVNRQGKARFSRPCNSCYKAIIATGINKIFYTLDEG